MNDKVRNLRARLNLPPIHQIGLLTRDVNSIVATYESLFGLGPFITYEFRPDRHWYKNELTDFRALYAKAMLGDVELCFMQPLEGRGIHMEYLAAKGEGLFNLGFSVTDYEQSYAQFVDCGFDPVARAESFVPAYNGYLKGCYFDTQEACGMIFEIMWKSWL